MADLVSSPPSRTAPSLLDPVTAMDDGGLLPAGGGLASPSGVGTIAASGAAAPTLAPTTLQFVRADGDLVGFQRSSEGLSGVVTLGTGAGAGASGLTGEAEAMLREGLDWSQPTMLRALVGTDAEKGGKRPHRSRRAGDAIAPPPAAGDTTSGASTTASLVSPARSTVTSMSGGIDGGLASPSPSTRRSRAALVSARLPPSVSAMLLPLLRAVHRLRHESRHVTVRQLLTLVEPWWLLSTLANTCNIAYAALVLAYGEAAVPGGGRLLLALAAAFDWLTMIQYLKFNGNYYLFVRTLLTSAPSIGRNIIGALPIYFTFVCVAVVAFGSLTERFDGFPWGAIAFFAVANGDVVRETFQMSLYYQPSWPLQALAQITMYLFCAVFIYCILKTTTAINEQSYLLVRPLPPGAKPGMRAAAIPNASGKADSAPLAFRLPLRLRRFFVAMQRVRDVGGAVGPVVKSAAAAMPYRACSLLLCSSRQRARQSSAISHDAAAAAAAHRGAAAGATPSRATTGTSALNILEDEIAMRRSGYGSTAAAALAATTGSGWVLRLCRRVTACCSCCGSGASAAPSAATAQGGYVALGEGGSGGAGAGAHSSGGVDAIAAARQAMAARLATDGAGRRYSITDSRRLVAVAGAAQAAGPIPSAATPLVAASGGGGGSSMRHLITAASGTGFSLLADDEARPGGRGVMRARGETELVSVGSSAAGGSGGLATPLAATVDVLAAASAGGSDGNGAAVDAQWSGLGLALHARRHDSASSAM